MVRCDIGEHEVDSIIEHNGTKVCLKCCKGYNLWLAIPWEKLRKAGWIE